MDRFGAWRSFLPGVGAGRPRLPSVRRPGSGRLDPGHHDRRRERLESRACSLREAVQSANINLPVGGCAAGDPAATDRITFASITNGSAILLSAGTLSTTSELEIVGNGPTQTIVDGGGATQPFLVSGGASALIQDVGIVNGRAINGGAISNAGSLVVVNTAISGSSATLGGAILNNGGVLSVFSSTLSGNSATNGGAIHNSGGGTVSVTSSTLSGNAATIGGAIYNDAGGTVSVTASTLSANTGGSSAGGIFNFSTGAVNLRATFLDTGSTGANCAGTIESFGSNLADDSTCFTAAGTDQVHANVRLGPLADNGGSTRTHALNVNSPAVDAVQGACTIDGADGGTPIVADQRGALRPSLGRGSGPARCDVGSYELLSAGELQFGERAYRVGEEGPAAAITVIRTGGDAGTAGATITLSGGTATPGEDYSGATFSVLFDDSETSKTVLVPIVDDQLGEPEETVTLRLGDVTDGVRIGASATAELTIVDNDPTPSLSIDDVSMVEGNGGTTSFVFTVTLTPASGQQVTVMAQTGDDLALAPGDYAAVGATMLTFAPTVTSQTFTVQVAGDALNEPNETFVVTLSRARNASIADAQGVGTILNDDSLPTLSIDDVTMTEGTGATTHFVFTVTLSAAGSLPVTVVAQIASGTATELGDYAAPAPTTLRFNPGTTTRTFTVPVNGDALSEPNESFVVTLSEPTNASIADGEGIGVIQNDDGVPTLSIDDVTVAEGNGGTTSVVFTVTLSQASEETVTVQYQTADGSASGVSDFTEVSPTTLTFGPRVTSQTITVLVNGDTLDEASENFAVNLSGAVNATLARPQGIGTIVNDDTVATLSIDDVTQAEGSSGVTRFVFTVTLSAPLIQEVTVQVQTADGNATSGVDYAGLSPTTLTFPPNVTTQQVTVVVSADIVPEVPENFAVNLSNATGATIAKPQGVGIIMDDDGPPRPRARGSAGEEFWPVHGGRRLQGARQLYSIDDLSIECHSATVLLFETLY